MEVLGMTIGLFSIACLIGLGLAIGMYLASQIENHIDKKTKK